MQHTASLALCLLLLLAACGGGGGGVDLPPASGVIQIDSNVVLPLGPTYRATFDTQVRIRVTGQPLPFTLSGTLAIENEGADVSYPLDEGIEAASLRHTLVLRLPATLRLLLEQAAAAELGEDVTLPSEITAVFREYVHVDDAGRWYSVGGQLEEVLSEEDPVPTSTGWLATPMLELDSTMFAGQIISNPATDILAEDLETPVATRANRREVQADTQILQVLGLRYEVYVADVEETLVLPDPGTDPITMTYRRWERPDLGLLRLQAEGLEITVPTESGDVTIRLETLDALIATLD